MQVLSRATLVAVALAASSSAQTPARLSVHGATQRGHLGHSVCVPGDLDGDEVPDFMVGERSSKVRAYSGANGRFLREHVSLTPTDAYGEAMRAAGDVNGDGIGDVVIGAPDFRGAQRGYGHVRSGADGSLLYAISGTLTAGFYGEFVDGAGDIDNDGFDDFILGGRQVARVYSGRHRGVLLLVDEDVYHVKLVGVAGLGDMDGDGFDDVGFADANGVFVISGRTRDEIGSVDGLGLRDFGSSMAAGDLDGDGVRDLIVGAPDGTGATPGTAIAFAGMSSRILMRQDGAVVGERYGKRVAAADMDGDGIDEMIVTAPSLFGGALGGHVDVYSVDGSPTGLLRLLAAATSGGEAFGADLDVGDLDADGRPDLVVGAEAASAAAHFGGRADIIDNAFPHDPGHWLPYGVAAPDFFGRRSRLELARNPALGGSLELTLRAAPFSQPAVVLAGATRVAQPLDPLGITGGTLYVAPQIAVPAPTDPLGFGSLRLRLLDPSLAGAVLRAQWLVRDINANPLGWVSSNGIEGHIGRG
ncbi:MAG: FG-GAP-like repeat-containing protein [Planctomycetota bacterium]